jgi:hypothetical protein
MLRRHSVSPEQARINIAVAEDSIAYAQANGLHVLPHWFETIERAEEVLRSAAASSNGRPERSRSFEPSVRVAKWHLRSAEETPVWSQTPARSHSAAPREVSEAVREWSDFTIMVSPSVLARIEREIHEVVWAFDEGVETGGWLYAHYTPDAEGVPIIQATGPGRSAKHSANRLKLAHPRELEDELVSLAVLVGDWHTHPAPWRGDPSDQASETDEEAWKDRLETLASCDSWVGLIFLPGVMGWMCPVYHGFLTHINEHGVVVCEQATVLERSLSNHEPPKGA